MVHRFTLEEIGHGGKATLSDSKIIGIVLTDRAVDHEPYSPIRDKLLELSDKVANDSKIIERLIKEHNKLVDLRDRYGLQDQGHAELHLTNFCLTGKLENTDHVKKIGENNV